MTWFFVALSAYLILAVANLLDKFLVSSVLKNSQAYAFVACILGSLVFLIAPWFLSWPGWSLFLFNILNGVVFALALWSLYEALRRGEAARTLVFIGGLTPVFSLLFSILFFKEHFSFNELFGLAMILVGIVVIIILPTAHSYLARILHKFKIGSDFKKGGLWIALLSALFYSLYFIGTKRAYDFQPFLSAFIWTRLGASLFVLFFLLSSNTRQAIWKTFHPSNPGRHKFLVIFNQFFGATGFILQNYAIFLGSVVLVNALQGAQYAFLLIISTILAILRPKLLKENFSWRVLIQKTIAVLFIIAGIYFIAV